MLGACCAFYLIKLRYLQAQIHKNKVSALNASNIWSDSEKNTHKQTNHSREFVQRQTVLELAAAAALTTCISGDGDVVTSLLPKFVGDGTWKCFTEREINLGVSNSHMRRSIITVSEQTICFHLWFIAWMLPPAQGWVWARVLILHDESTN